MRKNALERKENLNKKSFFTTWNKPAEEGNLSIKDKKRESEIESFTNQLRDRCQLKTDNYKLDKSKSFIEGFSDTDDINFDHLISQKDLEIKENIQ